jgi:hypothetical protein
MKHVWMALALIFIIVAAMSLWQQHYDAAFVTATLGALAWFLNYRAGAKEVLSRLNEDDRQYDEPGSDEDQDEEQG